MSPSHANFSGSIPAVYDTCLGPVLFEFSGADLAERIAATTQNGQLLEIACGTGISTEFLRQSLAGSVQITATDLNPGMLDYAKEERGHLRNVTYQVADALALPFENDSFEAVACQFGIMFFPDIDKGLAEMARVLKPGGFVALNVWDGFENNPAVGLAHEVISRYFESDPPGFLKVPFGSCDFDSTFRRLEAAGFEGVTGNSVRAQVECPSAVSVAKGFVEGNPGVLEIRERGTDTPEAIVKILAAELLDRFGPEPLRIPFQEFVFTGYAPG